MPVDRSVAPTSAASETPRTRKVAPPLPTLSTFGGSTASDLQREPNYFDLIEMVAAQRALVDSTASCQGVDCAEYVSHRRTLRLLEEELKRRAPSSRGIAQTALQAAQANVDILRFDIPPSHRAGVGRAVTAAKKAFISGLKPFHVEVLRPQQAFNQQSLEMIEQVIGSRGNKQASAIATTVTQRLQPLTDPTAWSVRSHRAKMTGKAVSLAKSSYLRALGPFLRELLAGQKKWNEAFVDALVFAASSEAIPEPQAREVIARLHALVDPLASEAVPGFAKASAPLWTELLRRQRTFNNELTLAMADLLGTRVPAAAQQDPNYDEWHTTHAETERQRVVRELEALGTLPSFTVLLEANGAAEAATRRTIDSLSAQVSGACKPVILRAGSGDEAFEDALNKAALSAPGDWLVFARAGDTVAPHALGALAIAISADSKATAFYADEDVLAEDGQHSHPFFKPRWSLDLIRSTPYVGRFLAVRRSAFDAVGGFQRGTGEAALYDLVLRLADAGHVVDRVAGVLYHSATTPPMHLGTAGKKVLEQHLSRRKARGSVEVTESGYRVRYAVKGTPLVSIIVPFKDKPELLEQLTRTLFAKTKYPHFELLLVSNNSTDPRTFELLSKLEEPRIRKLEWNHPFNYPRINNFAVGEAKGELLLFLNNDIEITDPEWLDVLVAHAQRDEVGCVAPKLLFPDGTVQHAGVVVGFTGFAGHPFWRLPNSDQWTPFGHVNWDRNYLAVTSACVMMRRDFFEELKGYDESFQVCGSDVDLGIRSLKAGKSVVYTASTWLYHHESASRRTDSIPEIDFWMSFVSYRPFLRESDPFYNPFLSLLTTDCSLRRDSRSGEELAAEMLVGNFLGSHDSVSEARAQHMKHVIDHVGGLDYTQQDVRRARSEAPERMARLRSKGRLDRITWFIPAFHHPYGGIHTILRFGDMLRRRHGVESTFLAYDNPAESERKLEARASMIYSELPGKFQVLRRRDEIKDLPECDLAISTLWTGAYYALEHPRATARAYFIQDYEPLFYPAGTYYALAEQTYRLGAYGIFNTQGLHDYVTSNYPMEGVWFEPAVEHELFHDQRPARSGPVRIFYYGRPSTDRNAFELGLSALRALKQKYGPRVEILTAGERWRPESYGMGGVITNLGVLPYAKTAELYRSIDIGLCFMFTKHPSYLPLEMMASGVCVVTNENPANLWLLKHEQNCLLSEPVHTCVLEQLQRAVENEELRTMLGRAGAARMRETSWEAAVDKVHADLVGQVKQPRPVNVARLNGTANGTHEVAPLAEALHAAAAESGTAKAKGKLRSRKS